MVDYITKEDIIIFSPEYNKILSLDIISGYSVVIFSNYELDNNKLLENINESIAIKSNLDFSYVKKLLFLSDQLLED